MEQTTITNDTNQPIETSPINPINPKPNIYKYLFIITLIILFGAIGYFVTTNSKNSQLQTNQNKSLNQTTKTIETNNENKKEQNNTDTKALYKAISVEDDKNSVSKLVLIDQNNNETVVDEMKYSQIAEETIVPRYIDFLFSPDNNFFYYYLDYAWEGGGRSYLYDIKSKEKITIGIRANFKGFSPDSKYFYACSNESGMSAGGAIVKGLNPLQDIFKLRPESSYECSYDEYYGKVIMNEIIRAKKTIFNEKTGNLTESEF